MVDELKQVVFNPGEVLKKERTKQNLTIEDVATRLHLTSQVVQLLEEGEFAKIHGDVFVRGYLRSYSKLLGVDSDKIIAQYLDFIAPQLEEKAIKQEQSKLVKKNNKGYLVFIVIGLVVLLLAAAWYINSYRTQDVVMQNDTPVNANEKIDIPLSVAVSPLETEVEDTDDLSDVVSGEQIDIVENNQGEEVKSESDSQVLKIEFDNECWVRVTDASNKVLVDRIYQKGSFVETSGVTPLTIVLGNAKAAKVIFNGQQVDVKVRSSGSASLKVGDS